MANLNIYLIIIWYILMRIFAPKYVNRKHEYINNKPGIDLEYLNTRVWWKWLALPILFTIGLIAYIIITIRKFITGK